jgi:hypothetical protein
MATIIEVSENKLECLSQYVEHILKYGGKLMSCLEEIKEDEQEELYSKGRHRKYRSEPEWEHKPEYPRYY